MAFKVLTVVILEQAIWNTDQPSLLKRNSIVVRKYTVGRRSLAARCVIC